MKHLACKFILFVGMITAVSCSDSEDGIVDNYTDEQYVPTNNILYVKEYGKQEMNMNTVESSPVYCIHVAKAGIDKSLPAHAKLSIIDQEELNKTYGLMDNIDYRIIPKETYSFSVSTTDLEFQPQEGSKEVNVTFHSDLIYEEMKKNEGVQYVLPIRLHSEKDSVDVLKNDILLLVDVKQPQITFKKEEVHSTMKFKNVDVQLEATLQNILSKWDFTCLLSDDNKEVLVNEYNKQHGTDYLPMPSTAYELPNLVFKKGINEANLTIPVSRTPLESDRNYLLPLKVQSISLTGFAVSDEVCYLSLSNPKYIVEDCDRSTWSVVFCNSDQKNAPWGGGEDGGGVGMLFDNNLYTYWHANYEAANDDNQNPQQFQGSRDLPHTIVVDMKKTVLIHSLGWAQRQNTDYQDIKKIEYYVSDDAEFILGGKEDYTPVALNNWEYLTERSYQKINDVQWEKVSDEYLTKKIKGHLLKIKIVESYRPPHLSSGSELFVKQIVAIDGEPVK